MVDDEEEKVREGLETKKEEEKVKRSKGEEEKSGRRAT